MIAIKWFFRMLKDIVVGGAVNRSLGLSLMLLALFVIGITIVVAQVASPFIYALF